jgi:hypothetical protein
VLAPLSFFFKVFLDFSLSHTTVNLVDNSVGVRELAPAFSFLAGFSAHTWLAQRKTVPLKSSIYEM